jgi:hypothetical protein
MNDELLKVKKHIGKKIYPEFLGMMMPVSGLLPVP